MLILFSINNNVKSIFTTNHQSFCSTSRAAIPAMDKDVIKLGAPPSSSSSCFSECINLDEKRKKIKKINKVGEEMREMIKNNPNK